MNDELNQQDAPQAGGEGPVGSAPTSEEKQWLMALHFSPLIGLVIPLASIIAPLVVWLIKKDEMPIINEHGKAVLNFQITCGIAAFICFVLFIVFIGILLMPLLLIFWLVMTVIGGIKAADGKMNNYILSLPLIK